MTSIREIIRRRFSSASPMKSGVYHYQTPTYVDNQYRLHLRIEEGGEGLLIIDASTILHLNQTAAEYAFHIVKGSPIEEAISKMVNRYDISSRRIQNDFLNFKDRIFTLIDLPDLDPVSFLDIDREMPYSSKIIAPYRMDCALTYMLPEGSDITAAPTKRVDQELTTNQWKGVITKAWDAGIPHIIFTGGEPTLREDLSELIIHTETLGQVTGLLTDGIKLTNVDYFQSLLQTGLDHLMIILNSKDKRVWEALEIVLPEDIHTTVHLTITPEEVEDLSLVLKKLADLGTNSVSLSNTNSELDSALEKARDLVAEFELSLVWNLPVPYSARNPISLETVDDEDIKGAGKAWIYIEPDGDVLPVQGINQVFGNLYRDNWNDIWEKLNKE